VVWGRARVLWRAVAREPSSESSRAGAASGGCASRARGAQPYTPTVSAFPAPAALHWAASTDVGAVVAGVAALFLAYAFVVVHRIRRRWRALRARADVRAGISWVGAWRGGRHRGAPFRWRYELWQAVADATRALHGAEAAAGGPIGELRSLQRRLRATADELDRLLVMAAGMPSATPEVAELGCQVSDALAASSAIRRAALAAASTTTGAQAVELASDAAREVQCVAAGVERSRAGMPRE
ncbi:MAG: hypothetical protein ACRD6W_18880, partial [Nitrososphaerales archaeon]